MFINRIIRYEDICQDPEEEAKKLFKFAGVPFTSAQVTKPNYLVKTTQLRKPIFSCPF